MKQYMKEIVANDSLKNRLCSDVLSEKYSHAYIIEGGKGSGKHTIARLTAAALACEKKNDTSAPLPCGNCRSCRKILEKLSPDVITVGCEGKATLGVDSIRFLREDVYIVPNELDNKIYIIEDADKMTVQAQNAFLLTLEEPPAYVGFILLCENAGALLETIRSRAPILRTEPIPTHLIDEYICRTDRRAEQLKVNSPKDYASLLISANGGIGRALELLDTKALTPLLEERTLVKDFIEAAICRSDNERSLMTISRFSQKRDRLSIQLALLGNAVRDLMITKKSDNAQLCFYEDRNTAFDICEMISIDELMKLYSAISAASDRITRNANVKLTLMTLLSESDMI